MVSLPKQLQSRDAWCAIPGVLFLGTGIDAVLYQSSLRPLGAEVSFFAMTLPAGVVFLVLGILLFFLKQRPIAVRIPSIPQASLFLLIVGFCTAFLATGDTTLHALHMLWWVFWLICLWLGSISERWRTLLFAALFISALLTSCIAVVQLLHQGSIGLSFLGEPAFSMEAAGTSKAAIGTYTFVRGYGLFPHPNIAFAWISLGLLAFFHFFPRWQPLKRPDLLLAVIILTCGLLATGSKSLLLLGIAVTFALFMRALPRNRAHWMGLGITFLALASVLLWFLWSTDTVTDRIGFLASGWQIFTHSPLGIGLGLMPAAIHVMGETSPWMLQPVHTTFGLLFVEAGIFGGLGWALFCASIVHLACIKEAQIPWPLIAAVFYIILSSLFDHFWLTYPATFLAVAWFFGAVLSAHLAKGTGRSYNKR